MLTSEEAGCPPTSPAECNQLDRKPGPMLLLPHMRSGRRSAGFVDALTDGDRNSSTNRPILWLTGEQ
ncbi:hypothetical protein NQZ68_007988 [Dissostichus eleginoides]|nr:hypothetical protein NQZ68_007988 [Dissostichus eleginoides]